MQIPRREHPKPQFRRDSWMNLNGTCNQHWNGRLNSILPSLTLQTFMSARMAILTVSQHPSLNLSKDGTRLYLLLSYHPADDPIMVPEGFDGTYYPFVIAPPRQYAIVRANERMIRESDYIIAYAWHIGKARDFVALAEKLGIHITNIVEHRR